MIKTEYIWKKPIYLPYLQKELTNELVLAKEKELDQKLPSEYIELLKLQNGGYIRTIIVKGEDEIQNDCIYGIGDKWPKLDFLPKERYHHSGELICFDGNGHQFLCLDYRQNKESPQITLIDTANYDHKLVADSFDDYLSLLVLDNFENIENRMVVRSEKSLNEFVSELESMFKIQFKNPESSDYNYDIHMGKINDGWLFVQSNSVPKGFIRPNESCYEEHYKLLKEESLQYPELGKKDLILRYTQKEIEPVLLNKLNESNINAKPLSHFIN